MGALQQHGDFEENAPWQPPLRTSRHWPIRAALSSTGDRFEKFLERSAFDCGPWLAVAMASGIATWFLLNTKAQWIGFATALGLLIILSISVWRGRVERAALLLAVVSLGGMTLVGFGAVWARSAMVGQPAIERPMIEWFDGRVIERIEQQAEDRTRLVLAVTDRDTGLPHKIRVNLPRAKDSVEFREGAVLRLRARLMPPAGPMLPGSYDFARSAWFDGLAASGSVIGDVELVRPPAAASDVPGMQRRLSAHVRTQVPGSAGHIAAAFASGDRGSIGEADEVAMRDAGLTHLLSISGLHVSAVIGAAYFIALKMMALFPPIALRFRVPLMAAALAALAGIAYTVLTGAQVPTVRSCIAALLVLVALALGREPLSLRMIAVAAIAVMIAWPEAVIGPSFQMSFAAVIAIVSLHSSEPVRRFLAPREEKWLVWFARRVVMLFTTGLVIEIALTPIVLYHFHRSGVYGAFANVVAIPLVTFVSMPAIAAALLLDLIGLGRPLWWLVGTSLDLLLWIAHHTANIPGAVRLVPQLALPAVLVFAFGALWIALWNGRARLFGIAPVSAAIVMFVFTASPDVMISRDGRHVGIAREGERLLVLRDTQSGYTRDNFLELSGLEGEPLPFEQWDKARCSADFCVVTIEREARTWQILVARSRNLVGERELSAACANVDIVIADRRLPRSCRPRWLKADRRMLEQAGGLSINLSNQTVERVADSQGDHGWWREDKRAFQR